MNVFEAVRENGITARQAAEFGIAFDEKSRKPPPKRKRRLSPEQRF